MLIRDKNGNAASFLCLQNLQTCKDLFKFFQSFVLFSANFCFRKVFTESRGVI